MSLENPYAAPEADLRADYRLPPPGAALASPGTRFVAATIDGVINLAISGPVLYGLGFYDGVLSGQPQAPLKLAGAALLGLAGFLLVNGYLLMKYGQTVGKWVTSIRIARLDNTVPEFWRVIALRWLPQSLVALIPVVGPYLNLIDILFIFRNDRRCIHDLVAGTQVLVVRDRRDFGSDSL